VSFAVAPGEAAYVPLAHDYPGAPDQLEPRVGRWSNCAAAGRPGATGKLASISNTTCTCSPITASRLRGIRHDTMLESYVLDSTARHDMDSLALKWHLKLRTIHFEDVAGKGAKQLTFNQVALEQAGTLRGRRCRRDPASARNCCGRAWSGSRRLRAYYEDLEIPLIDGAGADGADRGAGGRGGAAPAKRRTGQTLVGIGARGSRVGGQRFNLGSPKQLQMILFERLGLPVRQENATGQSFHRRRRVAGTGAELSVARK
jgi:DNA polymerase-1